MKKVKQITFNSGYLTIDNRNDEGKRITTFQKVPFEEETVTENRFNAALSTDVRISKVVHIPYQRLVEKSIMHNSIVTIQNADFEIWKKQPILTTLPPIIVLQLKERDYGG